MLSLLCLFGSALEAATNENPLRSQLKVQHQLLISRTCVE